MVLQMDPLGIFLRSQLEEQAVSMFTLIRAVAAQPHAEGFGRGFPGVRV